MKKTLLILGLISLLLLVGCNSERLDKFVKPCDNPRFRGSEGIVHNKDIDAAFLKAEPILGSDIYYYDGPEGNAIWLCRDDLELISKTKICKIHGYDGWTISYPDYTGNEGSCYVANCGGIAYTSFILVKEMTHELDKSKLPCGGGGAMPGEYDEFKEVSDYWGR